MPSTTAKQRRTMAACAHGASLDVCKHIPLRVAKEFNAADTGRPALTSSGGLARRGGYLEKRHA